MEGRNAGLRPAPGGAWRARLAGLAWPPLAPAARTDLQQQTRELFECQMIPPDGLAPRAFLSRSQTLPVLRVGQHTPVFPASAQLRLRPARLQGGDTPPSAGCGPEQQRCRNNLQILQRLHPPSRGKCGVQPMGQILHLPRREPGGCVGVCVGVVARGVFTSVRAGSNSLLCCFLSRQV